MSKKAEQIFRSCYFETESLVNMHGYEDNVCWHTLWGFAEDNHTPNRTCNAVQKIVDSKLKALDFDIRHGFIDAQRANHKRYILDVINRTVENQRKLNAEI